MRIIKLNAIDSTNTFLKQLSNDEVVVDYTVVQSDFQTHGRGQRGTAWNANKGENLMISVFKEVSFLSFHKHFYISMTVALAMIKTLEKFQIPKLKVKWPNDILSENKKVCGVLIENSIKHDTFKDSIIGVGLNVNQSYFEMLPNASSLFLLTGKKFDLEEILHVFMEQLKQCFTVLQNRNFDTIKSDYESYLFRKNKPSTFKNEKGQMFSGYIKSVSQNGNLQVLLEDDIVKDFDLKEITLMY